jgi:hypothetical protein
MRTKDNLQKIKCDEAGWPLIKELDDFLRTKYTRLKLEKKKTEILNRYSGTNAAEFEKIVKFTIFLHKLYKPNLKASISEREIDRMFQKAWPQLKLRLAGQGLIREKTL